MSDAVEAEANDVETVKVEWRDIVFEIPTDRDEWSFEAALALEEGKYTVAARELMPVDAYRDFLRTKPKAKDAASLINAIATALGMQSAGESPASSD